MRLITSSAPPIVSNPSSARNAYLSSGRTAEPSRLAKITLVNLVVEVNGHFM